MSEMNYELPEAEKEKPRRKIWGTRLGITLAAAAFALFIATPAVAYGVSQHTVVSSLEDLADYGEESRSKVDAHFAKKPSVVALDNPVFDGPEWEEVELQSAAYDQRWEAYLDSENASTKKMASFIWLPWLTERAQAVVERHEAIDKDNTLRLSKLEVLARAADTCEDRAWEPREIDKEASFLEDWRVDEAVNEAFPVVIEAVKKDLCAALENKG